MKICCDNEMTLFRILVTAVFLGTGNSSYKIVSGNFFLQQPRPRSSGSLSEISKSVIKIFLDEVITTRNTVKTGQCITDISNVFMTDISDISFYCLSMVN